MRMKELVEKVSKNTGFAKKDINVVLKEAFEVIAKTTLDEKEKIIINGFGTFEGKVISGKTPIGGSYKRLVLKFKSSAKHRREV
jgi:nucleoid DNA-binding protein